MNSRLETRPPLTEPNPTAGEWRNVTLRAVPSTVPEPKDQPVALPIVPPRRKKLEQIIKSGGFKEVFGNLTRRSSCDSASSLDKGLAIKRRNSSSDINMESKSGLDDRSNEKKTTLVRKVSKVGNRKSDQFFGENLSDCLSDEPVDPQNQKVDVKQSPEIKLDTLKTVEIVQTEQPKHRDVIDAFIQSNSAQVVNDSHNQMAPTIKLKEEESEAINLNKKAEFLMAMLDEYNSDEMRYYGTKPVEEPIIVPKRKHGRHICDDHDKLNKALHDSTNHSKNSEGNTVATIIKPVAKPVLTIQNDEENKCPKKPQRDFDRYKHAMESDLVDTTNNNFDIIQETTMSKAPPLHATNHHSAKSSKETIEIGVKDPIFKDVDKLDSILKKCNSSHSFLTPDLMDQIVNKVYGFKMNWDDHDNVHNSGYDDCSSLVAPSSKLKTRKISTIRKDQITEKPIFEEPAEIDLSSNESEPAKNEPNSIEFKLNKTSSTSATDESEHMSESVSKFSIGEVSIIVSERSPQTILKEPLKIQSHKEEHSENKKEAEDVACLDLKETPEGAVKYPHSNTTSPKTNIIKKSDTVIEIQKLENDSLDSVPNALEDIYSANRSVLSDFQSYLNEFPKEAITSKCDSDSLKNELEDQSYTINNDRRGSIVDHDVWFNDHKDIPFEHQTNRRASEVVSYDTHSIFPFGEQDKTSFESSDFFDSKTICNSGNTNQNETKINKNEANDHSTLLKFLPPSK